MGKYTLENANRSNTIAKRMAKLGKPKKKPIRKQRKQKKDDSTYNSSDDEGSSKRIDLDAAKYRKTYMNKIKQDLYNTRVHGAPLTERASLYREA